MCSECRDPADTVVRAQLIDRLLRNHAAVANQDQMVDAEHLSQTTDLGDQRTGIGGVALVHRDRDRASTVVGEQSEVDLQLAFLAITVVAQSRERTAATLEVARRQIVEHRRAGVQMARCELLLDAPLSFNQPVHGRVEFILGGIEHTEILGQGAGSPPARGGQLGVRGHDARRDHRQYHGALTTRS